MKHNPKFIYPKSIRSLIDDKRHYEIGTTKLTIGDHYPFSNDA
jgi:hypothetical protein